MVSNKQNPSSATYTASETQKGWDDLLNICYDENKIAKCDNLTSKRGAKTTPAPITMKQFDFNLPTDASISLVKLRYRDRIKGITEVLPEIEAPTITIKYGDGLTHTVTGKKPDNNMTTHELNVINLGLTGEQINSPDFSVVLSYPNNTGEYGGSVYVQFFEVEVEYDTPKYNVSFTEPRHSNDWVSWSTEDDPSHFALYAPQELTSYFRTVNGVNVTMQEVIYYIPKSFQVRSVECPYGSYEWIDETHIKWSVVAPLTKGYNKYNYIYKSAWIKFKLFPIANEKTELITATNKYCNATYYADIYDQFDTLMRNNDLTVSHSNFERYRDGDTFWYLVDIDSIPVSELEKMDYKIRIQTKIYNDDTDEYIDQMCHFTIASDSNRNYKIDSQWYSNNTSVVIVDASFLRGSGNNKIQFLMNGLFHDQYAYDRFMGVEGNYEFHISLFYEEDVSEPVLFKYPFYVEPAPVYNFELVHQDLVVGTPNIATRTGAGGCTFLCETQEGFGRWNSNMSGFKSFIENRYRHIGALRVDHSHYSPKYTFKNPVKEGSWKERKYFSKSGKWEDSLSLNIYLPFLDWKTLEGFVKMDKPVSIELCPTCPDEDVLNHRGWVELEDITNVERTNPWLYKGDIGVRYLTRKYWARATIIKGNRIINSEVPYTLINVLEKDDYFLDWFELLGAGQVVYDLDKNIVNEINCGTGESLHFRNRWVLKDINDYTFCWTSTLPSEDTDTSNDYQYNSITFSILDARDKTILLQYTLYDFRTYSDTGEIINTCNANCTLFKSGVSSNVFNKKIKLDWKEETPTTYGSNTRFEFNANYVTLTESGANGTEIYEQNIQLDSAEYLIDVSFDNNDVGLLEPNFTSHMGVIAYENALANQYSNFYEDMLISPFPLTGKTLLFYRKSEEGIIYYYQGDGTKGEYIINGFEQYKCGVDLQTSGGVSIVYVDNYTGTLYLNNNLIKVGFDRIFGTVNFYVYDITTDKFIHTNGVKLEKYDGFELVSLNDDKAQVKFGETIWTMWRGHPYIQCEHIDTDLRVIDNYDTINCESLRTPDGRVLYDGKGGKAEVDLNNTVTTTKLRLEGTDVPSFVGGTEITAIATVYNNEGDSIGFVGNNPIGKMEFIINGNSEYVDPKPSLSNISGEYEWVYKFTPPSDNAEYNMVARFLPLLNYFGSDSLPFYYDVHRLETGLDLKVNNSSNECVDVQLPVTDSNPVVINTKVMNTDDESISGVRVTALDIKTSKKLVQAMTSETGVDLKIPNNKIVGQGIYEYYVVADATETYDSSEDYSPYVRVYDSSKNPVLDDDITYTDVGKKIVFQSFEVDNPCRVKVNNDEFEVLHTYNYPITHSGTYNIKIFYDGDDRHQSYYHSGTITVDKEPLEITANFSKPLPEIIPYNSSIGINGSVSIQEPISVTLYDNGVPVSSTRAEDTFSIFYLCDNVGGHNLTIEFAGNEFISSASASLPPITVGKNDSVLRRCNGDVYRETSDMFQLVDSFDNPLSGKLVKYTINGVTYTRTTKEDGTASKLIQLFSGSYNVTVEFDGDDICTPCKLEYVLVVKDPLEVWNKAENISTVYGRTPPYQKWTGNEYDGLQGNKYIICGKGIVNNEVITGKDGTYPQPDDLSLSNYGFNLPTDAKIIKVTARWYERQINPRNSETYPKVGFGSAVLKYNDKEWGRLIGSQIPLQANAGFNIVSVAWNTPNIKVSELNSSALTVILKHDPNTNDNVGSVYLKYFEVGVSYVIEPERNILQPEEE